MAKAKLDLPEDGGTVVINNRKKRFQAGTKSLERPHYYDGGTVNGVYLDRGYYPDPIMIWAAIAIAASFDDTQSTNNDFSSPSFDTPSPNSTADTSSWNNDSGSSGSDYSGSSSYSSSDSGGSYDSGGGSYDSGGGGGFDSGGGGY